MPLTSEAQVLLREMVRQDGLPEIKIEKHLATELAMLGLAFVVDVDGDTKWFASPEGREAAKLEACWRCGRTGYVGERRSRDGTSPLKCRVCKGLGVAPPQATVTPPPAPAQDPPPTAPRAARAESEEKVAVAAAADGAAGFRALAKALKQIRSLTDQVTSLEQQAAAAREEHLNTYANVSNDRDALKARLEATEAHVASTVSLEQVKSLEASVARLEQQAADLLRVNAELRAELDTARNLYDQLAVPEEIS